jgi:hypothetical protein
VDLCKPRDGLHVSLIVHPGKPWEIFRLNQRPRTTLAAKSPALGFDLVLHRFIECTAFAGI